MSAITTNRLNTVLLLVLLAVVIGGMATRVFGGPLDPTGPPSSTMKTLDQIEPRTPISALPFTISQPGSYYLTKNLTATGAYDGITISAGDVTLDLGGFTLDGNNVGLSGVLSTGGASIVVKHGNAYQWTQRGFDLASVNGGTLDQLQAVNNHDGIIAHHATITNCVVEGNTATGLQTESATISHCDAYQNGTGYSVVLSTLTDSTSEQNNGTGIYAHLSVVEKCVLGGNHLYGILVEGSSNIRENQVTGSFSDGIRLAGTGDSSTIENNTIESAGASQSASGIWVETNYNHIANNNVTHTNGNGIGVPSSFNIIEDNSTFDNGIVGIIVGGLKNTVVRNTSSGNHPVGPVTNYTIVAGNNDAPVVAASVATNPLSNTQ